MQFPLKTLFFSFRLLLLFGILLSERIGIYWQVKTSFVCGIVFFYKHNVELLKKHGTHTHTQPPWTNNNTAFTDNHSLHLFLRNSKFECRYEYSNIFWLLEYRGV